MKRSGGGSPRRWGSALRRQLPVLIGVFAALTLIGSIAAYSLPAHYTATAEVLLDSRADDLGDDGDDPQIVAVRSRAMAERVAAALRLAPGAAASLAEHVSARRVDETLSLSISYTAPTAEQAARLANEYARQYGVNPAANSSPGARPEARILSEAEPPASPSSPHPLLLAAGATALAALLAIAAALAAERLFGGLTSGSEIEERLGLHHLGIVPTLASVVPNGGMPAASLIAAPMSGFAEAFRSLVPAIRYSGGSKAQVVAITSSVAQEGGSTLAACLARTIALGGESVVLIDARGDGAAALLRAGDRPRLAALLWGEIGLDEALAKDAASGAWLLSGTGAEPPEAIALLDELRRRFTHVLIDAPPILSTDGGRQLAALADLTVLAVRWRATSDRTVRKALALLPEGARIGGVVLTQVDMRKQVKYAQGDASYYYTKLSKYYS